MIIFIWDFVAENILGQIMDWMYARLVETFGEFFGMLNEMGAQLFDYPWTQAVVTLFSQFGWALYLVGLVVGLFEYAIESQNGRGDIKGVALGAIKGFLAVNLFATVPVELYRLCVTLQVSLSSGLTGLLGTPTGIAAAATDALEFINGPNPISSIALVILLGYSVFRTFFSNLKRGGILLVLIVVGSLYQFSVPRGYTDGFVNWCKQIIGLCLTTFLQTTMLVAGLMIYKDNMLMGTGLMLASTEVPRICGAFGLDTSTHVSVGGAMHTAQTAISTARLLIGSVG